ncbi:MAG: nicotinate-nucleotide adenylyltransferase [Pseudomonadota bacterium]
MMGVFGGTFDPIHFGHLRTAHELLKALSLNEVRFLPCGVPPHRAQPVAAAAERSALVALALDGHAGFVHDDRELHRDGPSYSVDTLESLRGDYPDVAFCLILGMDAFLGLPRWDRWQRVFELAHVVVAHRPGWRVPYRGPLGEILRTRRSRQAAELHEVDAGRIFVHPVTQLEISSTEIRDLIRSGNDPRFLLPETVRNRIRESHCYSHSNH